MLLILLSERGNFYEAIYRMGVAFAPHNTWGGGGSIHNSNGMEFCKSTVPTPTTKLYLLDRSGLKRFQFYSKSGHKFCKVISGMGVSFASHSRGGGDETLTMV